MQGMLLFSIVFQVLIDRSKNTKNLYDLLEWTRMNSIFEKISLVIIRRLSLLKPKKRFRKFSIARKYLNMILCLSCITSCKCDNSVFLDNALVVIPIQSDLALVDCKDLVLLVIKQTCALYIVLSSNRHLL